MNVVGQELPMCIWPTVDSPDQGQISCQSRLQIVWKVAGVAGIIRKMVGVGENHSKHGRGCRDSPKHGRGWREPFKTWQGLARTVEKMAGVGETI
jgi:hypothetical protein